MFINLEEICMVVFRYSSEEKISNFIVKLVFKMHNNIVI